MADIAVTLVGPSTNWPPDLAYLAAKYRSPILHLDWKGIPQAITMPTARGSRVAARQLAQMNQTRPRQKSAWQQVVIAKIRGQASNVRDKDPTASDRLLRLAKQVRSGDPANVEAQAARTYWARLALLPTFSRRPQAADVANSALNYGYAVIRGAVIGAIAAAGLNPTLSIYHRHRANPFGLADDLMEPFRPAVDHVVGSIEVDGQELTGDHKHALVGVLNLPMVGVGATVHSEIHKLAQHYGQYVEQRSRRLPVTAWKAP